MVLTYDFEPSGAAIEPSANPSSSRAPPAGWSAASSRAARLDAGDRAAPGGAGGAPKVAEATGPSLPFRIREVRMWPMPFQHHTAFATATSVEPDDPPIEGCTAWKVLQEQSK